MIKTNIYSFEKIKINRSILIKQDKKYSPTYINDGDVTHLIVLHWNCSKPAAAVELIAAAQRSCCNLAYVGVVSSGVRQFAQ